MELRWDQEGEGLRAILSLLAVVLSSVFWFVSPFSFVVSVLQFGSGWSWFCFSVFVGLGFVGVWVVFV